MILFKNISINKKLVLSFLTLALVPLIIIGYFSIYTLSNNLKTTILANEQSRVETKAIAISGFLRGIKSDLFVISNATALKNLLEGLAAQDEDEIPYWQDELSQSFKSFAESKTFYMQIRFLGLDGKELSRVDYDGKKAHIIPEDKLQNKSGASYFKKSIKLKEREIFISPLNLNKERGKIKVPYKPVIRYATPVFDQSGKKQGIVIFNVLAVNFLSEFKKVSSGSMLLINSKGYYLANTDSGKEFGFMFNKADFTLSADYPLFGNKLAASKKGGLFQEHKKEILTYKPIFFDEYNPDKYWIAIRVINKEHVFKAVNRLTSSLIIIIVVTTSILGFLSLFIARSISVPIQNIIDRLNESSNQVSSETGQISSSSRDLAAGATEQAASLEESSAALAQVSGQAKRNSENASNSVEISGQMAGMIQQTSENAGVANNLANDSKFAVEEGVKSMEGIAASMKEIKTGSDKITDIIEVLNDITHQTKMLATNAAIEAARAGEQGKGFAVVADEVSKLAENSKTSAKEISRLIKESALKAQAGSKMAEKGREEMRSILGKSIKVAGLVSEISSASEQQAHKVSDVNNSVDSINMSSTEQANGIEQVTKAMSEMEKVTEHNAASAGETAVAAEKLSDQAQSLTDIVHKLTVIVKGSNSGEGKAKHAHQEKEIPDEDEERPTQFKAIATEKAALKAVESRKLIKLEQSSGEMLVRATDEIPMRDDFKEF